MAALSWSRFNPPGLELSAAKYLTFIEHFLVLGLSSLDLKDRAANKELLSPYQVPPSSARTSLSGDCTREGLHGIGSGMKAQRVATS